MRRWLVIGTTLLATALLGACGSIQGAEPAPAPLPTTSPTLPPEPSTTASAPATTAASQPAPSGPATVASLPAGAPGQFRPTITGTIDGEALSFPPDSLRCASVAGSFLISPTGADTMFSLIIDTEEKKLSALAAVVKGTQVYYVDPSNGSLSVTESGKGWKVSGTLKNQMAGKEIKVEIDVSCG